jgi:hypothetical protein
MAEITLRVLDGADRGRVFSNLRTPVTIGREEGNTIQLNDERVSRFHVKIQEDQDKIVITDLESTNGTKVNGEEIQLRILRYGDVLGIGRSTLVFGTRDQIADRLAELRGNVPITGTEGDNASPAAHSLDFELNWQGTADDQNPLHVLQPPELPEGLSPGQAAQMSELLEYLHLRFRSLVSSVKAMPDAERMTLETRQWQNLLDLQARLAVYLRSIGHGDSDD